MKHLNLKTGFTTTFLGVCLFNQHAYSEGNPFKYKVEAVISGSVIDKTGPSNTQAIVGELGVGIEKKHYFDNGVSLGFVGEIRAQGDNSRRQTFAGELQFVEPISPLGTYLPRLRSPATGLSISNEDVREGAFATLEQAYVTLKSGWGEVSIGRDIGAAARLDARAPSHLHFSNVNGPKLNPVSISSVRARNDVTGPSEKITYVTPRLVGIQFGGSYTPTANARGIDFDSDRNVSGVENAKLENVYEAGASFSHLFRESDLRVRLGLTGIFADSSSQDNRFGSYSSLGAGFELEKGDWKTGVQFLQSNNGVREGGEYAAWEIGLQRKIAEWVVGAEYGYAKDQLQSLIGENWSLGVSKRISDNLEVGFAYNSIKSDYLDFNLTGKGAIIELIVRYE